MPNSAPSWSGTPWQAKSCAFGYDGGHAVSTQCQGKFGSTGSTIDKVKVGVGDDGHIDLEQHYGPPWPATRTEDGHDTRTAPT